MLTDILQYEHIEKLVNRHNMQNLFKMHFIDMNGERVSYVFCNDNENIEEIVNGMVRGDKYRLMMYDHFDTHGESILLTIEKVVYDYQPIYRKSDVGERERLFISKQIKKSE